MVTNGWDWINEEFGRANARAASLPPWARPVVTRPVHAGIPATPPLPPRMPLNLPGLDEAEMQRLRDLGQQMQDKVMSQVEAIARQRRGQVDDHIERHREAIEALQARGIRVWLEEGPTNFTTEQGDQWTMRATSTVRIRFTGDGR